MKAEGSKEKRRMKKGCFRKERSEEGPKDDGRKD
jgi:hypothetical protein